MGSAPQGEKVLVFNSLGWERDVPIGPGLVLRNVPGFSAWAVETDSADAVDPTIIRTSDQLITLARGPLEVEIDRGNGTIRVVDGQYKAFGQDVRITKGLLRYVDSPLSEPQLEIVAEREIKDSDITVAVNVRGTLDNPYISITSTPSMSSNEALSYLLTGRSIDTLQSGEAASVNQAAESLAVSGGGLLLGGIGTRLGLDEVSVERDGDEGDTQVVLGKALSPKLFVSYGISVAEAINTIKLRYTLNDRWSVKAEAGLEQSADIEYRIER